VGVAGATHLLASGTDAFGVMLAALAGATYLLASGTDAFGVTLAALAGAAACAAALSATRRRQFGRVARSDTVTG
jgi:hypothetical protein